MTNVALIKVLEDKLSDIALCHQADVEWQKKITLDFFIALLDNEYKVGYKDGYEVGDMHGYEQRDAEHNSGRCDNYQAAWEDGYNQGYKEGHLNGRDQS